MSPPRLRLVSHEGASDDLIAAEEALMLRIRAGDQAAYRQLVENYHGLVLGAATRFLASREAGWDVAQDVFFALWQERDRYQPQGRLRAYLLTRTLNRCRYWVRTENNQKKRVHNMFREMPTPEDLPANVLEQLVGREIKADLEQALANVSERMREALTLRFFSELSIQEIAEMTGRPQGTIKSDIFRGLAQLRHQLTGVLDEM